MGKKAFLSALCLLLLLCGCSKTPTVSSADNDIPAGEAAAAPFSCLGSGDLFASAEFGLTAELTQPLLDMTHAYYRSIGHLALQDTDGLFTDQDENLRHRAIWHTLIEIRKASSLDLRLTDYHFTVTVTQVRRLNDGRVELQATEDARYHFAAIADTLTQQYNTLHTFVLQQGEDGQWRIQFHESDDNPYYNFDYDEANGADSRLSEFLQDIAVRQAQARSSEASQLSADHPYDRAAARQYMQTYIEIRNGAWYAYDDAGGNCQNFGSQVLLAGGIPMDTEGEAQWYWYDLYDTDLSWINVDYFLEYARTNNGYGLVADTDIPYYSAQVGDLLIMGDVEPRHTTVITDIITDENGNTVDYLLCSNTSNYRNFPAGAYYYTKHWPVQICGWNE